MRPASWIPTEVVDEDDRGPSEERLAPTLVSLHFLRTALKRRWWVCVVSAVVGLLAAAGFIFAFPNHKAQTAMILTHSDEVASTDAMTTDVSLLKTRTVAATATARLGLAMTPEDFFASVKFEPVSSEVMVLTLTAPTDAEAIRRLEAFSTTYLEFRAEQLSLQSKILVQGMESRIQKLQGDVEDLSQRIDRLSAVDGAGGSELNDAISQRAYVLGRIEALQQSVEDTTLENSAVVSSSRIVDPAAIQPGLARRTIALGLASGLIGGIALGCGAVLFLAIISDRLRRRADVAEALGVSVSPSVGRISPVWKGWRWLPPGWVLDRHRTEERLKVAHAIEGELQPGQDRLAIACMDNSNEVAFAVAEAAGHLAERDFSVTIVDLSERPSRGLKTPPPSPNSSGLLAVLRPRGVPALANGTPDLRTVGQWDSGDGIPAPQLGDVTLVLADIDPTVGADHLRTWADRVILVVTAGRSSAEKIRTVGELIRSAGLDLRFAVLMHTERSDDSSGIARSERSTSPQLDNEPGLFDSAERFEAR